MTTQLFAFQLAPNETLEQARADVGSHSVDVIMNANADGGADAVTPLGAETVDIDGASFTIHSYLIHYPTDAPGADLGEETFGLAAYVSRADGAVGMASFRRTPPGIFQLIMGDYRGEFRALRELETDERWELIVDYLENEVAPRLPSLDCGR